MFQSLAYIWFVVQWIGLSALKYLGGGPKPGPLAQAGIDRAFGPQNQNGKGMIRPDRICQATDMDWHATFLLSPAYVFNANGVPPYQPGATPQVPIPKFTKG